MPKCSTCGVSAPYHELRPQEGGACLECVAKELNETYAKDSIEENRALRAEMERVKTATTAQVNAAINDMTSDNMRLQAELLRVEAQRDQYSEDSRNLMSELERVKREAAKMNVPKLVDAFLAWPLPKSVCSDLCVTMPDYKFSRSGTNLLCSVEAREMFEYVLAKVALAPDAGKEQQ